MENPLVQILHDWTRPNNELENWLNVQQVDFYIDMEMLISAPIRIGFTS